MSFRALGFAFAAAVLVSALSAAAQVPGKASGPAAASSSVPSSASSVPASSALPPAGTASVPAVPAVPAAVPDLARSDPSVWLGAALSQILGTFGAPQSVHAVRGLEPWQDDVVFVYDTVELYWFKDKVWQVRSNSAYGLRAGDSRETTLAALGEPLQRLEDGFVYQRPSRAWPLRLRLKFGESGGITDFYVYRADF